MHLVTPVLILPSKLEQQPVTYTVRPLFFESPSTRHTELERALEHFSRDLAQELAPVWKSTRHDALLPWTWNPSFAEHRVEDFLELRSGRYPLKTVLLVLELQEKFFGNFPLWPSFWFELEDPRNPTQDAVAQLSRWLKRKEKEESLSELAICPRLASLRFPHIQVVEVFLPGQPILPSNTVNPLAMLGNNTPIDGRQELEATGRCLSLLPDQQLMTAAFRAEQVQELNRLLALPIRRPILLVGPPRVGKTALLHEAVRTFRDKELLPGELKKRFYQLAPDRLISGMSYVGQWEGRLTAILSYAKSKDYVLHFDDLLGLFRAGKSRDSSTSIGLILKGWLEQQAVRVVGEITPEALGILRELDRGFVELFHLIPVREPTKADTWRMIIHALQTHPRLKGLMLDPDTLKRLYTLEMRHHRSQAFPGKALDMLIKLTQAGNAFSPHGALSVENLLRGYADQYGITPRFFRDAATTERHERAQLEAAIKGQPAVVDALLRVLTLTAAGLSDPDRPIATLLFTGPTGAGKTWSVKVLLQQLFNSPDALVRFDMNEFTSAYSVTRLIGTFDQPDGLLTSALRRNPFCILLLDEIEKAHPDVFTLLLQVMGEGRLTDALGRTVDFTSSIIIMTSNLGVREASRTSGFGPGSGSSAAWRSAVEAFFAPEFVNRLDEIVPFLPLSPQALEEIVATQLSSALSRSGLNRKKVVVSFTPEVPKLLLQRTRNLELGARAVRRTVEQVVVDSIGRSVAEQADGTPQWLRLSVAEDQLAFQLEPLAQGPQVPVIERKRLSWSPEQVRTLDDRLRHLEDTIRAWPAPDAGPSATPALERLELLEHLRTCQELVAEMRFLHEEGPSPDTSLARPLRKTRLVASVERWQGVDFQHMLAAEDVKDFLREHARTASHAQINPDDLEAKLTTLETLYAGTERVGARDLLLHVERVGLIPPDTSFEGQLILVLSQVCRGLGLLVENVGQLEHYEVLDDYLMLPATQRISGIQVQRVVDQVCGLHLLLDSAGHDLVRIWAEGLEGQPVAKPNHLVGLYSCERGVMTVIDARTGSRYDGPVHAEETCDLLGALLRDTAPIPRWLQGLETLEPKAGPRRTRHGSLEDPKAGGASPSTLDSTRVAPRGRRS